MSDPVMVFPVEEPEVLEPEDRDPLELPPNLAENRKLVKKFHTLAYDWFRKHYDHPRRPDLEKRMKSADALYRCSFEKGKSKEADQEEDTLSNVPSPAYFIAIRTITAGQRAALFYGDDLPARYEPDPASDEYDESEGSRMAKAFNMLLRYTFDQDMVENKIKESLLFNNKYGQELLSVQWQRRVRRKMVKEPVRDREGNILIDPETGGPSRFRMVERDVIEKDCPLLQRHDLKDAFFDLSIDDMQSQHCIVVRQRKTLADIRAMAASGDYLNVKNLNSAALYSEASYDRDEPLEDRHRNAGDTTGAQDITAEIQLWWVWMLAPIDDQSNRRKGSSSKTRGVWDEDGEQYLYEGVFAGRDFDGYSEEADGSQVECLLLRKTPYAHGRNPFQLIHSHNDDKGAIHMGALELLEGLVEEERATINEMIDNKTLRTRMPFMVEKGAVLDRDIRFRRSNPIIQVKQGTGRTAVTPIVIPDTTVTTMQFLELNNQRLKEAAGTPDAVMGQFAGARTTGTEYQGVVSQAMKPFLEDTEYVADQLFPWYLDMVRELWIQFGDPSKILRVTNGREIESVIPGSLYGHYKPRIVSLGQFEADALLRQSIVNLIGNGAFDKAAAFMSEENQQEFWRNLFKLFKIPGAESWFSGTRHIEAQNQAHSENRAIMDNPMAAAEDTPQPGEKHAVHLPIHQDFRRHLQSLLIQQPDNAALQIAMQVVELHIQATEAMVQQEEQQAMASQQAQLAGGGAGAGGGGGGPGQPMGMQANPAQLTGEAGGEALAGLQGQMQGIRQ